MRTLLLLALVLPACVVPKLVGPNPEADTGKDTDTDGASESGADTSATSEPGVTSAPDATTGPDATTDDPATTTLASTSSPFDMAGPFDCAAPTAEDCEAMPECMPVFGEAEGFSGCTPGLNYLGCIPEQPCDAVLLTVCAEETDESFRLTDGCVPPGFASCPGLGTLCGDESCAGLGADECAAKGCTPIDGAPHVVENDVTCADYDAFEFLGCLPPGTSCPPQIAILCPVGQTEPVWDVPSGCFLPGFETCEDQFVPACE
jgi:hypothetical protein